MDNQAAISLLQQQLEAFRDNINRQIDAMREQLEALGPPIDDARQRELRQLKSWKGFLSNAKSK